MAHSGTRVRAAANAALVVETVGHAVSIVVNTVGARRAALHRRIWVIVVTTTTTVSTVSTAATTVPAATTAPSSMRRATMRPAKGAVIRDFAMSRAVRARAASTPSRRATRADRDGMVLAEALALADALGVAP